MSIIAKLAAAISALVAEKKYLKEVGGTGSNDGLFKLLNIYLHWIDTDPYMSPEDKDKLGRTFQTMIEYLATRYRRLSPTNTDFNLKYDLTDCIQTLLSHYSTYNSALKTKGIIRKRSFYGSVVMTGDDTELQQINIDEHPATQCPQTNVDQLLNLVTKVGISPSYQLSSCERTKRFVMDNLKNDDLSLVLSLQVCEWLEELHEAYDALSNSTSYADATDVNKLLHEMLLWQRNVHAFATSVVRRRWDRDERDRLIERAESRLRERTSTPCCLKWLFC